MTDLPALLERAWRILSRWGVPIMMALAYTLLVATSDASATGAAWMAGGFALVMTAWLVFRRLTAGAALSRAQSVGDTAALLAIADRELARRHRPAARAPFLVARGFAQLLRGEHAAALASLGELRGVASSSSMATLIDILARIELDQDEEVWLAGFVGLHDPRAPWIGWLFRGAIACRSNNVELATEQLVRVVNDIRAGSALRAIAYLYLARVTAGYGDPAAARHRASAAALATPDATWLRGAAGPPAANP
jgi:hypothetical protein